MYILKLIGIKVIRAIVPLALKASQIGVLPPPKPDQRVQVLASSSSRGKKIIIDVFYPTSKSPKSPGEKVPIVINLHGSGFCIGGHGEDRSFCRYISDTLPCVVLDVAYSQAPEHPFPAALEDIEDVVTWLQSGTFKAQADSQKGYKWDVENLAITGFSSGGNLSMAACVNAHGNEKKDTFKAVVAFYPSTNLLESAYNKPKVKPRKGAAGGVLPPFLRKFFYSCYLPSSQSRSHPTISPLFASPDSFPPSTIITCEGDSLAREGDALVRRLMENGNDVVGWQAKGQGHSWDKMTKAKTEPDRLRLEAYDLAAKRLASALGISIF